MANYALLVGINDYKGISDLRGCLNDVTNVRSILQAFFGFVNSDIRLLLDDRATKDGIQYRFEKMIGLAKPGDQLVFHFSGHGSQIRDRDKDELRDDMDELICPYDMNWDNGFITDDWFKQALAKLKKGVQMEMIMDCCHSGTGTRSISMGRPEELGPEYPTYKRYLKPPLDIQSRSQGEEDKLVKRALRSDKAINLNHVLWAGCKDNQTSADAYINGSYNGAFSYYFCKHIRENAGSISRDVLLSRLHNSMNYNDFDQFPQLECVAAKKGYNIFSSEVVESK